MKKIFGWMLIASMAFGIVACSDDETPATNNNGNTEQGGNEPAQPTYRITSWADDWDQYKYIYTDGKVTKIEHYYEGDEGPVLDKEWSVTYAGNVVTIDYLTDPENNERDYTITLGENGYAASFADCWDTFTYTYDANGYCTQIKKNGEVASNIVVEDGCIVKWSKFDDRDEDGTAEEHWKIHTYGTEKNVAGIRNIYAERGAGRWIQEMGFFGKGTAYLCTGNKWDYNDGQESPLNYELDENGCVTHELKGWEGEVENFYYTWEVVE